MTQTVAVAFAYLAVLCLLLSTLHFGAVSLAERPHGFGHWQTMSSVDAASNISLKDSRPEPPTSEFHDDAPAKKRRAMLFVVTERGLWIPPPFHGIDIDTETTARVAVSLPSPHARASLPHLAIPPRQLNRGQAPPSIA